MVLTTLPEVERKFITLEFRSSLVLDFSQILHTDHRQNLSSDTHMLQATSPKCHV